MKKVCIVGAGIAGLFSAKVLLEKGLSVTIIESANEVGGLLRSFRSPMGQDFDFGTHIMRESGNREIDKLLFSNMSKQWRSFPILKTGSVVNGKLYSKSAFMNANDMDVSQRDASLKEFLSIQPDHGSYSSATEYLEKSFGQGLAKNLFFPALKKFFGVVPSNLHQKALNQFGMTRIVAFDDQTTKALKEQSWYDSRLSFQSYEEGVSGLLNYYPRSGGIGLFINELKSELVGKGAKIKCGQKIESIEVDDGRIQRLRTGEGVIDVDHLVWTLPIAAINKMCSISTAPANLAFRDVALYYFTFQSRFLSDLYYIMNFDPRFKSFRITLYQNLKDSDEDLFSCCVEVLGQKDELEQVSSEEILDELEKLNLIADRRDLVDQSKMLIPNGFPILTNELVASSYEAYQDAQRFYKNVSFVGKSSGKVFFTNDILLDTFELLGRL